ncbi:hypothetical protein [Nocardia caishijiensis]|uniref:Uncharacterized protein n=1 Tax=Nocardia caishijiensis TaxID=184756 RepID=A0ABQ6YGC9_9NOCA|nr:hypothetical protein [Nocardia caishijiensis]KAF0844842.1 hypothetical protein FNL39_11074 [Nocardia caishijiensis]
MAERTPSRAITGWTVGLWSVAAVAGGVIVGGLLHEPEPELTTAAPTTSVPATSTTTPTTPVRIRAPVTFPTQIPGCASVDAPSAEEYGSVLGPGSYDNPAYPWFSGRKAVAMSTALRATLPTEVVVEFGPHGRSLLFDPILGEPGSAFGGFTGASADLRRGDRGGSLWVTVEQSDEPVPACTAGWLDERRVVPDGSTIDLQKTWEEIDGIRTLSHRVSAYRPDGSRVTALATDAPSGSMPSGAVPLTVDELITVVLTPGLAVGDPIPPGTLEPPLPCQVRVDSSARLDEAAAIRVNAALRDALDGVTTDRPLDDLRPSDFGDGGLCQTVRVTTEGQASTLSVSIALGQPTPTTPPQPGPDRYTPATRTTAEGAVIETREEHGTTADRFGRTAEEFTRTLVLTAPGGTRIDVTSTAEAPSEPLSFTHLETIALTSSSAVR